MPALLLPPTAAVLAAVMLPAGPARVAGALLAAVVAAWSAAALPEALTALLFFAGAVLLRVAPPAVVFAGLASPAFWLVFSGLIVGTAVRDSGLSRLLARHLARLLRGGARRALAGAALCGLLLSFLMPSAMGRVVLLVPVLQDLATRLGLPPDSRAAQVNGFSTLLLPYESPPLVAALQLGAASRREMVAACAWLAAASVLLVWPAEYFWLALR